MDMMDPHFTLRRQQNPIPKRYILNKLETIKKFNKI